MACFFSASISKGNNKKNWLITCSSKVCHCAKIPLTNTGCPKSSFIEFHALYLLIKTIFLGEIFRRCLFLYQVHVFRISVTSMPFLFFFITFCSLCGMNLDTACRPTNDPFWAFLSLGAQDPVQPPNKICLV